MPRIETLKITPIEGLYTTEQKEILNLRKRGLSQIDIAAEKVKSVSTIKSHTKYLRQRALGLLRLEYESEEIERTIQLAEKIDDGTFTFKELGQLIAGEVNRSEIARSPYFVGLHKRMHYLEKNRYSGEENKEVNRIIEDQEYLKLRMLFGVYMVFQDIYFGGIRGKMNPGKIRPYNPDTDRLLKNQTISDELTNPMIEVVNSGVEYYSRVDKEVILAQKALVRLAAP